MFKFRAPLLAGLVVIGGLLAPSSVKAAPCPTGDPGILISVLATPESSYSCELGGFGYLFDNRSGLSELTASATAALVFQTLSVEQKLVFKNLANASMIIFVYFVTPISEEAREIKQSYLQSPSGGTPLKDDLTTVPSFSPASPTTTPFEVRSTFEPDGATLTELTHTMIKTHTMVQTPAPLPLLGAGLALGFTRKLRRRIAIERRSTPISSRRVA